jgi:hypothetical protein
LESSGEFGGAGLFLTALGGDDDGADGGGELPAARSVARASPSAAVPSDGGLVLSAADEERLARLMGSDEEEVEEEGEDGAIRGRRSCSKARTSGALEERAAFLEQGAAGRRIAEIDAALERARGAEGADVSTPAAHLILSRSTRSLLRRLPAEDGDGDSRGRASSKQPPQSRRSQSQSREKKALSKAEHAARRKERQREYARRQQEKQRQKRRARAGAQDAVASSSSSAVAAAAAARAEEGARAVALNFDHENLMIQEIDGRISDIQSLRLAATESSVAPRGVIDRLLETVKREAEQRAAAELAAAAAAAKRGDALTASRYDSNRDAVRRRFAQEQASAPAEERATSPKPLKDESLAALLQRAQGLTLDGEDGVY